MKKLVWKYQLEKEQNVIMMPENAEILSAHSQNDIPCIWALVNPDDRLMERQFEVIATGRTIPYDMGTERRFIGTVLTHGGMLVFHIFERIN